MRVSADGMSTAEVWRKHGIWDATLYKWRAKFGGMSISDAQKLTRRAA